MSTAATLGTRLATRLGAARIGRRSEDEATAPGRTHRITGVGGCSSTDPAQLDASRCQSVRTRGRASCGRVRQRGQPEATSLSSTLHGGRIFVVPAGREPQIPPRRTLGVDSLSWCVWTQMRVILRALAAGFGSAAAVRVASRRRSAPSRTSTSRPLFKTIGPVRLRGQARAPSGSRRNIAASKSCATSSTTRTPSGSASTVTSMTAPLSLTTARFSPPGAAANALGGGSPTVLGRPHAR